jgi:hypothetical protein
MVSCSLVFIVLLLFVINVDSRRLSQKYRIRQLWHRIKEKLSEKTANVFNIDIRHFDKEEMILFPDVAYQALNDDNTWKVTIHGWRYNGDKRKGWFGLSTSLWIERLAASLIDKEGISYLNESIDPDRLKPFFVEDESNELIDIKIGEKTQSVRTDNIGEFYQQIEVTNDEIQKLKQQQQQQGNNIITYEAFGDNHDNATGIIYLIEPRQGISVISDIDDTIKISEVLDKVRLLANTFIHPFRPVLGKHDQ